MEEEEEEYNTVLTKRILTASTCKVFIRIDVDPGGRVVQGVGPRPFGCWNREFESR